MLEARARQRRLDLLHQPRILGGMRPAEYNGKPCGQLEGARKQRDARFFGDGRRLEKGIDLGLYRCHEVTCARSFATASLKGRNSRTMGCGAYHGATLAKKSMEPPLTYSITKICWSIS